MRKFACLTIVVLALLNFIPAFGQPAASPLGMIQAEKDNFIAKLGNYSKDSALVTPVSSRFEQSIEHTYSQIEHDRKLTTLQKEKAYRSILYFIRGVSNSIADQKIDMYDVAGLTDAYAKVLIAVLHHQPVYRILEPMPAKRSEVLAAAFTQFDEFPLIDDVAVYKRVSASPEYILQFLEGKPEFRFADSLVLQAAADNPLRLLAYAEKNKNNLQEKLSSTNNIYLQQILSLAGNRNASELIPFITQLAAGSLTTDEILEKRKVPQEYFQLMVDHLITASENPDVPALFLNPLRNGVRQKAMAFYVDEVNERHTSADAFRFASVKDLRPQDLYYIITTCGEDLYTSSYLGLYKRLMEKFGDSKADSLFDLVHFDNYNVFLRMAANYNVLNDFLTRLSDDKRAEIIHRFVSNIEKDETAAVDKAMDIADSFGGIVDNPDFAILMQHELKYNLARCRSSQQFLGVRLYGILLDILDLAEQKDGIKKLWTTLGNYEVLKRDAVTGANGEIVQLVLFYGDDDGIQSFRNFLQYYSDASKWEITKNDNWVGIRSLSGAPLRIFANRPLEIKSELDLRAQDSLMAYLRANDLSPSILVHRGHSYHLDKTLRRLTPSVKLAILGSCGGYNRAISIATINPDIQVIGSKKTGSKSINDPIINTIDETLVSRNDLVWSDIWKSLDNRFSKDETNLGLFHEYFPPSNNLGLFVLKLYNYYTKTL